MSVQLHALAALPPEKEPCVCWPHFRRTTHHRSQSHFTTDGQSVGMSSCLAPLWVPRPDFTFSFLFAGKLLCSLSTGALFFNFWIYWHFMEQGDSSAPPLVPILSQINQAHTLPQYFFTIDCNIIFLPMSRSGLEIRQNGRRDPSRWPRGTLYPQKLPLTSPTTGGRSVGIVRSRTQATELSNGIFQRAFL
jgi:hypothetical protein